MPKFEYICGYDIGLSAGPLNMSGNYINYYENDREALLSFCYLSKSMAPPAITIERPVWKTIENGVHEIFKYGGFLRISVVEPKDSFVKELTIKSLPGVFRLIVATRSADPKEERLVWWELDGSSYRGETRFGDDDWDSRTTCEDVFVALNAAENLFEIGDLKESVLSHMRPRWNPLPKR